MKKDMESEQNRNEVGEISTGTRDGLANKGKMVLSGSCCFTIHITIITIFVLSQQIAEEIVGRKMMTTAKIQGTDDSGSSIDAAASQSAQYSMRQAESAVAHPDRRDDMSATTAPAAVMPMSNWIDPQTTDALGQDTTGVPITLSNDQSKVVELFSGVVTAKKGR
ncbi:hypothetical protein ALC53_10307 [Atta colombica]|uniref:Uncharacterized protein n=1 Tax=Atta colombica TaxID=520822 RepID=A0A195B3S5_9HYME|nr:hypothetical protein ALC53_10307 [Atta colombica]